MDSFTITLLVAMLILLLFNTWYQFRVGFRNGTKGGYQIGMYHAIAYLISKGEIKVELNTTVGDKVAAMIRSNSMKNIPNIPYNEIMKMAEAQTEQEQTK